MKKITIIFLLLIICIFSLAADNDRITARLDEVIYEEEIETLGKTYNIKYYLTNEISKESFEILTHIIPKPDFGKKSGSVSLTHSKKFEISANLEISSKVKSPLLEIGSKLTFGARYEVGSTITSNYNWEYDFDDIGDYGIFGIKRTAFNYYYMLYEVRKIQNSGNKGNQNEETEYIFLDSGNFWRHSYTGVIALYVFSAEKYNNVIISIDNGEFSNHMIPARKEIKI